MPPFLTRGLQLSFFRPGASKQSGEEPVACVQLAFTPALYLTMAVAGPNSAAGRAPDEVTTMFEIIQSQLQYLPEFAAWDLEVTPQRLPQGHVVCIAPVESPLDDADVKHLQALFAERDTQSQQPWLVAELRDIESMLVQMQNKTGRAQAVLYPGRKREGYESRFFVMSVRLPVEVHASTKTFIEATEIAATWPAPTSGQPFGRKPIPKVTQGASTSNRPTHFIAELQVASNLLERVEETTPDSNPIAVELFRKGIDEIAGLMVEMANAELNLGVRYPSVAFRQGYALGG